MKSRLRTVVWIVLAAIVVAAIVASAFFWTGRKPSYGNSSAPTPVYAPTGQAVAGFPSALLIDSGASITKSYSLAYSLTTNQFTVEWNSSSSPQNLAIGYELYFSSNGWRIVTTSTSSPNFRSLYAVGPSGSLNFTASVQPGGSAVIASYVPFAVPTPSAPRSLPATLPTFLNPDPSGTVIASESNSSSTAVVLSSDQNIIALAQTLFLALAGNQWQVVQKQVASSSAFISASFNASKASIIMQKLPSGKTQVQIQYAQ